MSFVHHAKRRRFVLVHRCHKTKTHTGIYIYIYIHVLQVFQNTKLQKRDTQLGF